MNSCAASEPLSPSIPAGPASSGGSDRGGTRQHASPSTVQGLAGGGQHPHPGTARQQCVDHRRGRIDDVLAVVEDEQGLLGAQVSDHCVGRSHTRALQHARAWAALAATPSVSATAASSTNHTPSGKRVHHLGGHLQGQAGLAAAPRPGDRHQPLVAHQARSARRSRRPAR